MHQVQDGLFAMEDGERAKMPCSPRELLRFTPYVLPGTLGRFEPEEAAARILTFSQQLDQWVGVSWLKLIETIRQDYETEQRVKDTKERNYAEMQRYAFALQSYRRKCVLTLGIYALFVAKPIVPQTSETPNESVPFSGIFVFGPRHVINGIHELIDRGLLRRVIKGEGENALDVFFPTPALVAAVK